MENNMLAILNNDNALPNTLNASNESDALRSPLASELRIHTIFFDSS
jgi:hypothetical protein